LCKKRLNKFKTIILCFLLLFSLGTVSSANQQESEEKKETKEAASLKKSLFVPGWGQLAEKHTVEGIVFLAAEIFCLYNVLDNNHKGNENYAQYKEASTQDEAVSYRTLTETYDRRRNLYLLAAFGVWAVNLIDIYVIVNKNEKNKDRLSLKIEHGGYKRLVVSVSFGF
jgi:hypothetical protein